MRHFRVCRATRHRHSKLQVLQCGALGHLPMNTSRDQGIAASVRTGTGGHFRHVELEIPDMSQELVLVNVPSGGISNGFLKYPRYSPLLAISI